MTLMDTDETDTREAEITAEILREKNARTPHALAIAQHNKRIGELQDELRKLRGVDDGGK